MLPRPLVVALLCAVAGPVVPATAAVADENAHTAKKKSKPTLKVATTTGAPTITTSSLVRASAQVTCPTGTQAVGGGFTSGFVNQGVGLFDGYYVSEAKRIGVNQWTVSAIRLDLPPAGNALELTAVAQCARAKRPKKGKASAAGKKGKKGKVKISEASVSAPLPSSTTTSQSATATCPKKTAAIGGGFSVANSGTDIVTPLASRPEGTRGWFVTGYNGAPNPHTVTSYAYCASVKVTGQSGSATLAGQSGSLATADAAPCPRTLAGGGFQFAQPSVGQQSWPAASLPVGASWRTIAFNSGGGGAATPISSYGACL